jgi:hypothetical protein
MATQSDFRVKKGLIVGTTDTANPEAGTFTYDADFETVDLTLDANVNARLAQDHYFYVKAGATITKGDVVYASGAVGNSGKIEASPYIANNTIDESVVLGVAAEDIATGNFGYVAQFGSIRRLDASGGLTTDGETWNNGDILYASPTYAGELTKTKPSAPNQDIPIAFVISNNGSSGTIAVRASRLGYHMDEVHDVEITSIADKDLLVYNTSNSRWENGKTIGDLTLTGELNGPATFYIDPAPHDPDTDGSTNGLVVIRGDLQVDGTTTTVNSTTVEVADKNIVLGANATADSQNDGAGITITLPDSSDAVIQYLDAFNTIDVNKNFTIGVNTTIQGITDGDTAKFVQGGEGINNKFIIQADGSNSASPDPVYAALELIGRAYDTTSSTHGRHGLIWVEPGDLGNSYRTDMWFAVREDASTINLPNESSNTMNRMVRLRYNGDFENHYGNFIIPSGNTNGKIGIGTGSPGTKLEVYGEGSGDATYSTAQVTIGKTNGPKLVATQESADNDVQGLAIFTKSSSNFSDSPTERVRISNSGSVGIGTIDPQEKLHVEGGVILSNVSDNWQQATDKTNLFRAGGMESSISNDTTAIKVFPANGSTLSNDRIGRYWGGLSFMHLDPEYTSWGTTYTGTQMWIGGRVIDTSGQERSALIFATNSGTTSGSHATERMCIDHLGNVGIGTDSPVGTLDVRSENSVGSVFRKDFNGPVADTFSKVAVTLWGQDHDDADVGTGTDQFGPMLGFGARIDDGDPNTGDIRAGISYSYNGDLTFHAKAGASVADGSYERMRIDGATGNVGIGESNPIATLHIDSSVDDVRIINRRSGTQGAQIDMLGFSASPADGDNVAEINMGGYYSGTSSAYFGSIRMNAPNRNGRHGRMDFYTRKDSDFTIKVSIDEDGHMYPGTTTQDLGTSTDPWQNIYTQDLNLSNEKRDEGNSVDGTKGNWTIQEGDEHLYIINNKSGKKYRFALEEIE